MEAAFSSGGTNFMLCCFFLRCSFWIDSIYFEDEVNWSKKSSEEAEDCGDEAEAIEESKERDEEVEESDGDEVEDPKMRGGVCSRDS